jgi:hypothetical protein
LPNAAFVRIGLVILGSDLVLPSCSLQKPRGTGRIGCLLKLVVLSFAGVLFLSGIPDASAQKKRLTYEQDFAKCKEDVNRTLPTEFTARGGMPEAEPA